VSKKSNQYKKEIRKLKSQRDAQRDKTKILIDRVKDEREKQELEKKALIDERNQNEIKIEELEGAHFIHFFFFFFFFYFFFVYF
jgi:hypothetical protein